VKTSKNAVVARLAQGAHEVSGSMKRNVAALPHGLDAKRDGEVSLTRPDRPGKDDVVSALDERAARELGELGALDADGDIEIVAMG